MNVGTQFYWMDSISVKSVLFSCGLSATTTLVFPPLIIFKMTFCAHDLWPPHWPGGSDWIYLWLPVTVQTFYLLWGCRSDCRCQTFKPWCDCELLRWDWCAKSSAVSPAAGWSRVRELKRWGWKATMTHCSLSRASLSHLNCYLKSRETSKLRSTCSPNSWKDDWWKFSSLSDWSTVIFSMARPSAFTAWKTLSGRSKETSCIRRGLSISGRSSQARCPTPDQELWVYIQMLFSPLRQ